MNQFIEELQRTLSKPLPGPTVQGEMLPGGRDRQLPKMPVLKDARRAGVCIVLYQKENCWYTVLIKRTTYKGVHSGQIAFPGGTEEAFDDDLIATALRETEEEVGINRADLQVLGQLSSVYIPPSNMYVEPTVALLDRLPVFKKEEREVDSIIEVPINRFLEASVRKTKTIKVSNVTIPNTPYFDIKNEIVWGATAAMINEFIWVLNQFESK